MARISINLLPNEFLAEKLKNAKFYKIQMAGVGIILVMVFLTSLTVALRILQSGSIAKVKSELSTSEQKVSDLKNTQASLVLLKDRLASANQYLGVPSRQSSMYQLINRLVPPSVVVGALTIDKDGQAVLSALVPDIQTLDSLMSNLTNPEANQGHISQVSVDSLTRGRDAIYRVSFKIKP